MVDEERVAVEGERAPDRSSYTPWDTVRYIWSGLSLPEQALDSLALEEAEPYYQSSFKISHIAQSCIALSALSAALVHSLREQSSVPKVSIPLRQACLAYHTERLFLIDGKPVESRGQIGGLHATSDGHVRVHDSFPNHRNGTLELLGLGHDATREDVCKKVAGWKKLDLEEAAYHNSLVIYALRSYDEWDALPHAIAISNFPILIRKISDEGPAEIPPNLKQDADRCLRGLRVVEMSRVIAAPVAGQTLAAHGADVLWVTSPKLPDLPSLDRNLSRGKRTIQLDLGNDSDYETMRALLKDADVFIQGYRPASIAAKGLSPVELAKLKPGLVVANLSAFGPSGPWSDRRGFDSLVQTASGMNVSEAQHFGGGADARPMPVQALDHSSGYLLATGICAALYKRATEGGSWQVDVSLAGLMKYLRSLGQYPGDEGFQHQDPAPSMDDVPESFFEERDSAFGCMRGLKHAAVIEGAMPGFEHMPKPLGSDDAKWLQGEAVSILQMNPM